MRPLPLLLGTIAMLAGASSAAQAASVSGAVLTSSGAPVAGATVAAAGNSTTTGTDGYFSMTVPDGEHAMTVASGSTVAGLPAWWSWNAGTMTFAGQQAFVLHLPPDRRITVAVLGDADEPLPSATVRYRMDLRRYGTVGSGVSGTLTWRDGTTSGDLTGADGLVHFDGFDGAASTADFINVLQPSGSAYRDHRLRPVVVDGDTTFSVFPRPWSGAPSGRLGPEFRSFGDRAVGGGRTQFASMTVRNKGTSSLRVRQVGIFDRVISYEGAEDFLLPADRDACTGAVLAPEQSCGFAVAFDPSNRGHRTGEVRVYTNEGDRPLTASVTGWGGGEPLGVLPAERENFRSRDVAEPPYSPFDMWVRNDRDVPLTIDRIDVTGPGAGHWRVRPGRDRCTERTVSPGDRCEFDVTFDPTAAGAHRALLEVHTNAPESPLTMILFGTGTATDRLTVSPGLLDFGVRRVDRGHSGLRSLAVRNRGSRPVDVTSTTVVGPAGADFAVPAGRDGCAGETLAPKERCFVEVGFDPSVAGPRNAILAVGTTGGGAGAALRGTGS